jgi:hypothetical protein
MSDVSRLFVLGAGFSAAEQFPLVRGLRERVVHFLEAERHSSYRAHLQPGGHGFQSGQFYAGLTAIDAEGRMEFEELLIALSNHLKTADGLDPRFVADRVLRTGCARLLWCIQNSIWRVSKPYENFAARVGSEDAVLSFNWDLLVEKMLVEFGRPWSYRAEGPGVPVIKPHGSINWSGHLREGLRTEYAGWQPLGPGSQLSFDVFDPLSNSNKQEINTELRYMIFPGDTELPAHDNDVRWLWGQAETASHEKQALVFIGYSLAPYDGFALEFLERLAHGRRVEAYTPSADHLARYREIFGDDAQLNQETLADSKYGRT